MRKRHFEWAKLAIELQVLGIKLTRGWVDGGAACIDRHDGTDDHAVAQVHTGGTQPALEATRHGTGARTHIAHG